MTEGATAEARHVEHSYHFDRHTPQYRYQFEPITSEMLGTCPLAWTDTYGGHWVAAGSSQVFELARCPHISNDNDIVGERKGYRGINIPRGEVSTQFRGGMLEMDDPGGTVHYETIGVIQGMQHLPATFTPGRRTGAGLAETLEKLQRICDEQQLAAPITVHKATAVID